MATQAAIIAALTAIQALQVKTAAEIVAVQASVDTLKDTIKALEEKLDDEEVSDEIALLVEKISAQAQDVDNLIPDLPPIEPPPVEDPPADPAPVDPPPAG